MSLHCFPRPILPMLCSLGGRHSVQLRALFSLVQKILIQRGSRQHPLLTSPTATTLTSTPRRSGLLAGLPASLLLLLRLLSIWEQE